MALFEGSLDELKSSDPFTPQTEVIYNDVHVKLKYGLNAPNSLINLFFFLFEQKISMDSIYVFTPQ